MKELNGSASALVAAPIEDCLALCEAVDRYPVWCPEIVTAVEVLDRAPGGRPTRARTRLHVAHGALARDFDLTMGIVSEAGTVRLTKVSTGSQQRFDVVWRLSDGARTGIRLDLRASLDVPRFLPLGGVGDALAARFVAAAGRALGSVTGGSGRARP
jgi:ribosome-associated toxin RatA of RatAB toxin-antitoxin module